MSDIGPIIFLIVIIIVFVRFNKYYKTELRYKYLEVQKEFEKTPSFKNVFIFREPGQLKTNGTISAEFKNFHISIQITGDTKLEISLKAYTLGDNQPSVLVNWEPVYLAYNSLDHVAKNLVSQTSEILSSESKTKYDRYTISVSYKREIPIKKRREYSKDLDDWFRTTNNYYD
jgi:hypothetical protein